jgi:molybdenum cofactor biosynthesis protein B
VSAGDVAAAHRAAGRIPLAAAVITASDTRGPADDPSGDLLAAGLGAAGVTVAGRRWVRDEQPALEAALRGCLALEVDAVLVTGGTGLSPRDVTPEAVRALGGRDLPGFGELFRMLSYADVGAAAALSRTLCVAVGRQVVYALPGSPSACRLALEKLILPDLAHVLAQLRRP